MARKASGGGDPQRTLRLLWGPSPRTAGGAVRGRRPRIGVPRIVDAAVALADEEGLEATTMSAVARRLGVGTMSLYTHVPGKAELLDLMVDAVWRELELPPAHEPHAEGWRGLVALYARRTLAVHRAHPWLREISTVRPPLGPGLLARQEYLLAVLATAGLDASRAAVAADALATFVDATAAAEAEHAHAARVSGQPEGDWWQARQEFWDEHFDPGRYPAITRAWKAGGLHRSAAETAADAREFGLRVLLDGIEAAAASSPER
ncbi:TetR/AcrR family transcriptional regulator [Streptomyces cacaoi]|uniref:TetR/AcrR family transcriptional regulator n=1 Tax=Streptomyces cacaoi TaxID=1898 RepID=UPI0011F19B4F|nr:TetR/AcrR family transcriptional regulator [Streptomyces cacaoi]